MKCREDRQKDLRWYLTWTSYLFQLSSISWRLNIFPQPILLNCLFEFLVFTLKLWAVALLLPEMLPIYCTLPPTRGTITYLSAQAINLLVRLTSHSSSLLTATTLPSSMIFPYKYFLRSLHYSYSHCHKFPRHFLPRV